MKNKQDMLVGIITIIATIVAMIFSLNYTSKVLTENAHRNTVPIIIDKKDPNLNTPKIYSLVHTWLNGSFLLIKSSNIFSLKI